MRGDALSPRILFAQIPAALAKMLAA